MFITGEGTKHMQGKSVRESGSFWVLQVIQHGWCTEYKGTQNRKMRSEINEKGLDHGKLFVP